MYQGEGCLFIKFLFALQIFFLVAKEKGHNIKKLLFDCDSQLKKYIF